MVCEFSTFFSGIECRLALSNVFMLHRVCRLVGLFSLIIILTSMPLYRASDISRKEKQNFAGFSGANSRKNRPISREKKSKFAENSADFRDFRGKKAKFAGKLADFVGF